jgi:hypothetical protein
MFTVTWTDGYRMDIDACAEAHELEIAGHLRKVARHQPEKAEKIPSR